MPPPPPSINKKKEDTFKLPQLPPKQPVQQQQQKEEIPNVEYIYKEPFWSQIPTHDYKFEVIKNGTVIETIDLSKKSYYLIGRLPPSICDISLEHPTISRQHAIIQHRDEGKVFLYDLGSTHGSFINKKKCKPNVYNPIKNGDVLKFGESTRILVLNGPDLEQLQQQQLKTTTTKDNLSSQFVKYFSSKDQDDQLKNQQQQKQIQESRNGWMREDHDEEINSHYNSSNDDQNDNSSRDLKSKKEDEEEDEDDDDEFFDRTSQFKEKLINQYKNLGFKELMEKREELEREKLTLQSQFEDSTKLQNINTSGNEEEEDSLDRFMNENEGTLKRNAQQKIMNSLLEVNRKVSTLEQILKQTPEYKKNPSSIIPKSTTLNTKQSPQTSTTTTISPNINNNNKTTTTKITNENLKSNNIFNDDNQEEVKYNPMKTLSEEIPEEYISKTKKKRLSQNITESTELKTKKLKEKQESEFVDLISREEQKQNNQQENSQHVETLDDQMNNNLKTLPITCDACRLGTYILDTYLKGNASLDEVLKGTTDLCIKFKLQQPEVCTGILHNFVPIIWDVLIISELNPLQLCEFYRLCPKDSSSSSSTTYYEDDFEMKQKSFMNPSVSLKKTKTKYPSLSHQKPLLSTEAPSMKANSTIGYFLQISDIHFDPDYVVGSNPNCGRPLCCRDGTGDAGVFGHYLCDIPYSTVEAIFEHLATLTDQIDFIVWTGDNPPHNVWEQSQSDQTAATETLSQLIYNTFPNTIVLPSIGNHEAYPSDQYLLPNTQWLLNSLQKCWAPWLDEDSLDSVQSHGYYTTLLKPGLRVISLNTLDADMINFYNLLPTYLQGPNNQSDWFINVLEQAEANFEQVLIIGHIPCTLKSASTDPWCVMYEAVISRFSSIIAGQFYGHTHYDQIVVFSDPATHTQPTGMNYVTPSMTTYQNHEPGYRIYEYDYSTNQVLNYYQYHTNLTEANLTGKMNFSLSYSAKELYNLPDLTPASWFNLAKTFKTDDTMFNNYYQHIANSPIVKPCDAFCQIKWTCEIFGVTSQLFDQCAGV
eukprot:gene4818-6006_t